MLIGYARVSTAAADRQRPKFRIAVGCPDQSGLRDDFSGKSVGRQSWPAWIGKDDVACIYKLDGTGRPVIGAFSEKPAGSGGWIWKTRCGPEKPDELNWHHHPAGAISAQYFCIIGRVWSHRWTDGTWFGNEPKRDWKPPAPEVEKEDDAADFRRRLKKKPCWPKCITKRRNWALMKLPKR